MKIKFTHTNILAKDWKKLSHFYQEVFGCVPVPPERVMQGDWIDRMTGIRGAQIRVEHLRLPGYEDKLPTLEIFPITIGSRADCNRLTGSVLGISLLR